MVARTLIQTFGYDGKLVWTSMIASMEALSIPYCIYTRDAT